MLSPSLVREAEEPQHRRRNALEVWCLFTTRLNGRGRPKGFGETLSSLNPNLSPLARLHPLNGLLRLFLEMRLVGLNAALLPLGDRLVIANLGLPPGRCPPRLPTPIESALPSTSSEPPPMRVVGGRRYVQGLRDP